VEPEDPLVSTFSTPLPEAFGLDRYLKVWLFGGENVMLQFLLKESSDRIDGALALIALDGYD
jgi:hypothetical protein